VNAIATDANGQLTAKTQGTTSERKSEESTGGNLRIDEICSASAK